MDSILLRRLLESAALPPALILVLLLLALLVWRRRGAALGLTLLAAGLLYLSATPWLAHRLVEPLQSRHPAIAADAPAPQAGAIVILSASHSDSAPEFGGPRPGSHTLERLRYGAHLHQRWGLPVLVAGGRTLDQNHSAAEVMSATLEQDYGITPVWLEPDSRTTFENARFSAELLRNSGIERIVLVTHASHMPRALWVFEQQGMEVVAAPTGLSDRPPLRQGWPEWIPSADAMSLTARALHEHLGWLWYRLRHS